MINYNNGKIYKIEPVCDHDEGDIYILVQQLKNIWLIECVTIEQISKDKVKQKKH